MGIVFFCILLLVYTGTLKSINVKKHFYKRNNTKTNKNKRGMQKGGNDHTMETLLETLVGGGSFPLLFLRACGVHFLTFSAPAARDFFIFFARLRCAFPHF